MKQDYYVAQWEHRNMGKQSFVKCPSAKKVVVQGFEELDLFVHRELLPGNQWAKRWWRISEATTGMLCGGNEAPTIAQCIENTRNILERVGRHETSRCIENAPKSPYYVAK